MLDTFAAAAAAYERAPWDADVAADLDAASVALDPATPGHAALLALCALALDEGGEVWIPALRVAIAAAQRA